ncbi:MAG: ABC transporter permease [Desulfobacterales bacterium]|nr:MAG: ABC transporter permease [Desulfobacterales bacterium]
MLFDQDNWREIGDTLKQNKLRSVLTAFGVFWGIFMLMIMLGAGTGLENGAMHDFNSLASNSVFLWTRPTTKPYKGFPRGRRFYFNNEDIDALRQHIPEIEHIGPRNQLGGYRGVTNVTRGSKNGAFNIYGDYPEIAHIMLMDITAGRFIHPLDLKDRRKVAVIGSRVYEILFDPGANPVGHYILVKGVYFKVIGVFASRKEGDEAAEETQTVFIPFTTFQQAFNTGNLVGWFSLTSRQDVPASAVEKKAAAFLGARHQVAPDDVHAIGRWNAEKDFRKMTNLFARLRALTWFVGICTLMAGVIGVSNIMLYIVKERTREIGIKRAVGATPLAIVGQIVLESVVLTTASGYCGLVAGVALTELVASILRGAAVESEFFKNPEISLALAVVALAVLIVSGALAGLIPAQRAIRIRPVEAIRDK